MKTNPRILLLGKQGQVGFELSRALAPVAQLIAVGRQECDLTNADGLRRLVRETDPAVIVNAAAYTDVDKAESDRATAFAVNRDAPRVLGEEAARIGAAVIHYSTDYVFDGSSGEAYGEADPTGPLNVYGESKLQGELGLADACGSALVLRTSWVFGSYGTNFVKSILRLAADRNQLNVVSDQVGTPTCAALIADVTAHLICRLLDGRDFPYGLYHFAAAGYANRFELAKLIVERAVAAGLSMRLNPLEIVPISTCDFPAAAPRPLNSRLAIDKFEKAFDFSLPNWQDGLSYVLDQLFHK
jgi:dTDP-4-dehydrorhamnose reductase